MGVFEVAGLIFMLVEKFGPSAKQVWDDWHAEVGDNPTDEQWAAIEKRIIDHNPDTY
jgi:hypothetical protein